MITPVRAKASLSNLPASVSSTFSSFMVINFLSFKVSIAVLQAAFASRILFERRRSITFSILMIWLKLIELLFLLYLVQICSCWLYFLMKFLSLKEGVKDFKFKVCSILLKQIYAIT